MIDDDQPRPLRADAVRNRQCILAVAEKTFHRDGYRASLEGIARDAGVGVGTLYRHFPSREDLVTALVGTRCERLHALALTLQDHPMPFQALQIWLWQSFQDALSMHASASVVELEVLKNRPAYKTVWGQKREDGEMLLSRARENGSVRAEVTIDDLGRLASGSAMALTRMEAGEEDARRLFEIIISGIRATP